MCLLISKNCRLGALKFMWTNRDINRHFVGQFNVVGEDIPGEMIYNNKNGMILLNLNKEVDQDHTMFDKIYGKIGCISGKLNTGEELVCCNCNCIKNHTENFTYQHLQFHVDYMIIGKSKLENQKFNSLTCVVENALNWSELSQVEREAWNKFTIKTSNQNTVCEWYGAKIKFSTCLENDFWKYPRREVCTIVERLKIEIECSETHEIEYFMQIRNNIFALISFAIKDNINIEDQYVCAYDEFVIRRDNKEYVQYHVIGNEPYYQTLNIGVKDYNFKLGQISQRRDLNDALNKLSPVFNLYLSLFKYAEMPTEMIFLNIVQALETFHSRFFYGNKKGNYIKSVKKRFGDSERYKKLLLSDTQIDENCGFIILVSRLNDLLIGNDDGLFSEYYIKNDEYAQTIADTRHYYTHYGKSKEDKALKDDELIKAICILRLLLEYHVCLVLGINRHDYIARELRMCNK